MASKEFKFLISATERGVKKTFDAVSKGAGTSITTMGNFNRAMGVVNTTIGKFSRDVGGVMLQLSAVIGGIGYAFKRGLLDPAAKFEDFTATLTTIEGSGDKAKESMAWISDFASSTPFSLEQVTGAFVKLRAYGMDPTDGLLRTIGDTASGMGKDVMQAVEAIADAVTGENERLKEFGIKALVDGNEIRYSYTDKAGQQLTKVVDKHNRAQIQSTLSAIWNEKFAGAMEERSRTWNGMMSNIADQWTRFRQMLMDAGAFDYLKGKLNGILTTINEMAASGKLQELADLYGKKLVEGLEAAWAMAVKAYEVMQQIGPALVSAAKIAGGLVIFNTIYGVLASTVVAIKGIGGAFFALTQSSIIAWLGSVLRGLTFTTIAAQGLKGALKAAGGVLVAWQIGTAIGSWLNQFEIVQKVAQATIATVLIALAKLQAAYYQTKIAAKEVFGGDTTEDRKKLAAVEAEIVLHEQLRQEILADGDAHQQTGNKAKASLEKTSGALVNLTESAKTSAAKQAKFQGEALDKMKEQYAKYVEEIKKYQDQIAGRERDLSEELRSMARSGMDGLKAWKDQKAEAEEYEKAARKAAEAGDFAGAIELADKAKEKFKALNQEVKDGDQIMVSQKQALETAMGGVERSGQLAINILKEQETAARNAAEALTEQSGFQDLSAGIEGFEQVWATSWQHMQDVTGNAFAATEKKIFSFASQMDEATAAREITIDAKLTPEAQRILDAFADMPGVSVTSPAPIKRQTGGPTGQMPGYGGGDRIPLLVEGGEYVIRKEAVARYGSDLFAALNQMKLNLGSTVRARVGGLIAPALARAASPLPIRRQTGGSVPQVSKVVELRFPTRDGSTGLYGSDEQVAAVLASLEEAGMRA